MIIDTAKKCTVAQFIEAKYENNLSVLGDLTEEEIKALMPKQILSTNPLAYTIQYSEDDLKAALESARLEALQKIHIEFCDLTGNENMPELPIMANIAKTQQRIMVMEALLFVQRDSMQRFGKPDDYGFPYFEHYNHKLTYSGDNEAFLKELTRIENKERKYKLRLAEDEKSLENIRTAQTGYTPIEQSRIAFIDMLIDLGDGKGRDIDQDKTTMEMLGIMIAKHNKAARDAKNN